MNLEDDFAVIKEACPLCGQGRLFAAFTERRDGVLYVVCEDCEAEWQEPSKAETADAATHGCYTFSKYATVGDLQNHPWRRFVANTPPDE